MMKKLISKRMFGLLSVLLMIPLWVCAQNITVTGEVTDMTGEPLPGVNVIQKGQAKGVVTNLDGKYITSVPSNATLVFSYVGYSVKEVAVNGQKTINVTLTEDNQLLNDVVVVGYGTMKRSDIAGSVTSVNTADMMKRTPVNVAQGLQGAAAGVIVSMQDGAPDANAQIRIRGVGTINGTAAPLYVVDGVQVGTDANFLNPSDIESIEILKDASATAIYGSQGANGVIMITTKHGNKGQLSVNFTADFGIQTLGHKLKTLGIDDFALTVREAAKNGGQSLQNKVWDPQYDGKRKYIDWQDEMTRTAIRQQYGLSISGGSDKSTYSFSLGYLDNDGLVVGTNMNRLSLRANVTASPTSYLTVGGDINYVRTESNGSNIGNANNGNLSSLRDYAYWTPTLDYILDNTAGNQLVSPNLVNPDGTYGVGYLYTADNWEGNTVNNANPYATQMELAKARKVRNNRINASAFVEIKFLPELSLKSIGSYSLYAGENNNFQGGNKRYNYIMDANKQMVLTDMNYEAKVNQDYSFDLSNNSSYNMGIETYLTYNWRTDFNTLTLMAGNTVSKSYGQWVSGSASGFLYEWNRNLGLAPDQDRIGKASGAFNADSHNISYYGRLAYSLLDRYLLTATIRRDGSSNFGSGNRWGTFPSFAAGWRFSEEDFMKDQTVLTNGKVRFGWGQTGNSGIRQGAAIAALTASDRFNFYPGQNGSIAGGSVNSTLSQVAGLYQALVNTDLKWETNEQLNIGLDLAFLNGALDVTVDWFRRDSKDLLLDYQLRPSSGETQVYTNYGTIRNTGFEFAINYNKQINKDLHFHVGVNASTLKNEVIKMGEPLYAQNTEGGNGIWNTIDGSNIGGVGDPSGWHWGGHSISKEGEAVGSFYGFRTDGIIQNEQDLADYLDRWRPRDANGNIIKDADPVMDSTPAVGDFKYMDLNGDHVLDENDRDILGNGIPKFTFGINLGVNYKNWDFSTQLNGVLGQKIFSYSAMRLSTVFMSDDQTFPNILQDSWSQVAHVDNGKVTNPGATIPALKYIDPNYNMRASDAWVKNGDYIRMSNLQVGYTVPKAITHKLAMQNIRAYASVQNVFCISKYSKYGDPEVGQGSVLYTGFDTGRYPMPRTYQLGLQVTF